LIVQAEIANKLEDLKNEVVLGNIISSDTEETESTDTTSTLQEDIDLETESSTEDSQFEVEPVEVGHGKSIREGVEV
jgi:hypothetical protein